MAAADWIFLLVVGLSAFYGLATGLVRGALALAGFALGAYVGARVAPMLLTDGSPYGPVVALAGAVLGGTLLRGVAGLLGGMLRTTLGAVPGLRTVDSAAGFLLGAAAGVVLCWAVGAVLLYLPGQADLRRSVQESTILSRINDVFPPESLLATIERVDPLGVLGGPTALVPPPDGALARDPDVLRASRSVVRIRGIACGLGVEGSGWIVRRGLVVTNAHVVAGVSRPLVDRGDDSVQRATVVAFDDHNDVAVLRVPGLEGRPLPVADPERSVAVVVVGYPENGPLERSPARLGGTNDILTRDAYGRGPVTRVVTTLRGVVRPGNSGGPGVDARGRVRTTVFARRPGEQGGFGVPPSVVRATVAVARSSPVKPTECAR